MKVIRKKVGCKPEVIEISNTLEALQREVGGNIEVVASYVIPAGIFIVNEEGIIQNLKRNCKAEGHDLYGTILFAGVSGEEFCDVPKYAEDRYKIKLYHGNLSTKAWVWR